MKIRQMFNIKFKIAERSDILNSTFDVGRSMFGFQIGIFLESTVLGINLAPTRGMHFAEACLWQYFVGAGFTPAR